MLNIKKIAYSAALAVGLLGISVLPSLAATKNSGPSVTTLSCVATAVTAREQALSTGISAYTQAVTSAYSARAAALKQAWSGATWTQINTGVKAAWSQFRSSMKAASSAWKGTREGAWRQFASASKTCKAPVSVTSTEASGQSSEVNGQ